MTELYEKSLRTLEFPRVLEMLAGQCVTQEAKDRAMKLRPSTEEREVQRLMDETTAARAMMDLHGAPSFSGIKPVGAALQRAELGGALNNRELLDIAAVLRTTRTVSAYCDGAEERNCLYLHFTMEDNPSLSPRIRARYERAYSGTFYRRFILGEWTAAKGLIYDFFMPQEYCARVPEKPWELVRISIDYGTVNPTSFGLWALKDGVWYRAREYYFDSRREGQQKTDAEYVADLKKFAAGETVEKVIVDPSAASFIEALRREGFPVSRADNDVADGIRVTANLLKQRKIVICEGCESCLAEIAAYCWEDSGTGRDRPKKERDHAMDEMRYFAVSIAKKDRGGGIAMRSVERAAR